MPDHNVLFGASLGQWNGADAADAAGRIRLGTQADRDGLDLFTVADHQLYRESRPRVDAAAAAAGRDPAEIIDVYNWTTVRPASSTATPTTPPPKWPWPAGPPR